MRPCSSPLIDTGHHHGFVHSNPQPFSAGALEPSASEAETLLITLQTTDVELAFCTGPGSQNLGILHMGIPPWVETSVRIVMSAWKVPIGIPVVKKKGPAIAATGREENGLIGMVV